MKTSFIPMLLVTTFCLLSCNSNEKVENTKNAPLEYFYIDATNILHIDNKCEDICETTYGTKPVNMYPISQIYYVEYRSICATCMNEKHFDELHIYTTNNIRRYYDIAKKEYSDVTSYENFVRYLEYSSESFYNDISKKGYVLPSYHDFCSEIAHPNQIAVDNQRKVYNILREKHPDIPDNFEKFRNTLSDTNVLRILYDRMKQDDIPFLPSFESLMVDLGLVPNQPAQLKLLL